MKADQASSSRMNVWLNDLKNINFKQNFKSVLVEYQTHTHTRVPPVILQNSLSWCVCAVGLQPVEGF